MRLKTLLPLLAIAVVVLAALTIFSRRPTPPLNAKPVVEVNTTDATGIANVADLKFAETDWPQWRGANISGVAARQAVPTTWSDQENIAWRSDVPGRGHASPILIGGLVVLATALEESEEQLVLAFDRKTGEEKWRTQIHKGKFPATKEMHPKSTHANGTVASDGSNLYVTFLNDEKIYATALDMAGEIVWQKEAGTYYSRFGYAASPILYKSLLLIAADNWGSGFITAMDRQSGDVVWRKQRTSVTSFSTPLLAKVGGRDQLVICGTDVVVSFNPATGETYWSTPATTEATCGTPVTDGKSFFASGGYPIAQTVAINGEDGSIIWENNRKLYEPSLLVTGGNVFGVTDKGIAYCWAAADGKEQWKKRLSGGFSASPVLCGENIFVPNLSGETFVFKANGTSYQQIARNELGNDSYSSMAIAGGDIVMRVGVGKGSGRQEQLVCIRKTE
ncbi:MAG: PQQ-binding-like beta-propeller repeat protein [Planctomycetaceae bacterium]